jgi:iron(III) transport system ATP-binding protein
MVKESYALRCAGLSKTYGNTLALDGFDLDLPRGQILALLGPSGCGKTTALRIIAGFEAPDSGSVEINGRTVAGRGVHVPPEKRRAGLVFQDYALFPHMSVGSNVAYGLPKGRPRERVGEVISLVGLQGLENRMPHQLSGGQQQRVALARTLAAESELVLLDEPFSNLDPSVRARVRLEVKQLIRSIGITAVFVTHDQEEALSLAELVGVMMDGRILQIGTPDEVYSRPVSREVAEFLGGANFLPGEVKEGIVECELGTFPVEADFKGPADVMFRSEALTICEEGGTPAEVVELDYYGHDQMVTLRLASGALVRVRLLSSPRLHPGDRVGVMTRDAITVFPRGEQGPDNR